MTYLTTVISIKLFFQLHKIIKFSLIFYYFFHCYPPKNVLQCSVIKPKTKKQLRYFSFFAVVHDKISFQKLL